MPRAQALTGLRFFAAMAIVLWHSQAGFLFGPGAFAPLALNGAVALFYVLSGYVLALNSPKYKAWPAFFIARVARIWPAHAVAFLLLAALFYPYSIDLIMSPDGQRHLLANALLVQAWSPDVQTYWSYNAVSWSVSCELFFYLAFPLCLVVLRRSFLMTAAGLAILLATFLFSVSAAWPNVDPLWLGYINPLINLPAFVLGVAAGLIQLRRPVVTTGFAVGTGLQLAALALAVWGNQFMASEAADLTVPPQAVAEFVKVSGACWCYATLIFVLARYNGAVSAVLAIPVFVYLGEISYAIYLFHQPLLRWHAEHHQALPLTIWGQYACVLLVTVGLAAVVHHFVEQPVQRWVRAGLRGRSGPAATVGMPAEPSARDPLRSPAEGAARTP